MITSDTIETMLLKAVKADSVLGLLPEIKKGSLKPVTESTATERISIRSSASDNSSWQHSFAYVYIYCPWIKFNDQGTTYPRRNSSRTAVLEAAARSMFRSRTLCKTEDGVVYYKADSVSIEEEEETFSTVITVKLRVTNDNF